MSSPSTGYIKLHRIILESSIWRTRSSAVKILAITCLLLANHREIKLGSHTISRGSFLTSFRKLADICHLRKTTIEYAMSFLTSVHFLGHKPVHNQTLVTILNYNDYQSSESYNSDTFSDTLPDKVSQSGTASVPIGNRLYRTRNEEKEQRQKVNSINRVLKEDFKASSIPQLQIQRYREVFKYPDRFDLKESLIKAGYSESETGKILERVYPQEYTGKAV